MGVVLFALPLLGDITLGTAIGLGLSVASMFMGGKSSQPPPPIHAMTSSWGNTIPLIWNNFRIAGQVIQAGPITQVSSTGKKSKKKGANPPPTDLQTLALAVCEGPRSIGRIWADNDILYDPRPITDPAVWVANTLYGVGDVILPTGSNSYQLTATVNGTSGGSEPSWNLSTDAPTVDNEQVWIAAPYKRRTFIGKQFDFTMRVYTGTEDQVADSALEEIVGAGNQPAYRGLTYVVFEDFNISKFGNRVPNFEFEIVEANTVTTPYAFSPTTNTQGNRQMWSDPNGSYAYFWGGPDGQNIVKLDLDLGAVTQTGPTIDSTTNLTDQIFSPPVGFNSSGKLWSVTDNGPNHYATSFDRNTLDIVDNFELTSPFNPSLPAVPSPDGTFLVSIQYGHSGEQYLWMMNTTTGLDAEYDVSLHGGPANQTAGTLYYTPTFDQYGNLWFYDDHGKFWMFTVSAGPATPSIFPLGTHSYTGRTNDGSDFGTIVYNPDTDIAYAISRAVGTVDTWVVPINVVTKTVGTVMSISDNESFFNLGDAWGWHTGRYWSYYYTASGGFPNAVARFDTQTGTSTTYPPISWDNYPDGRVLFYSSAINNAGTSITTMNQDFLTWQDDAFFFPIIRSVTGTMTLGDIIADISGRVGLDVSDYDYSGLDSVTPRGMALLQRGAARSFIESIQPAYFFDLVDVGEEVVGSLRSVDTLAATIPETDLAASIDIQTISDKISSSRSNDIEIPQDLGVQYYDIDHDYQMGAQQAKRSRITQYSEGRNTLQVPVVLNAGEAANMANRTLYMMWIERTQRKFSLPMEYIKLMPSDVVSVQRDGKEHVVRLTKTTFQATNIIECEALSEDLGVYTIQVPTVPTGIVVGAFNPVILNPVASPNLVVLDTALLSTADNHPGVYAAGSAATYGGRWGGEAVDVSADGVNFTTDGLISIQSIMGTCGSTLGNCTNWAVWDNVNTLTVTLLYGTLANISEADALNLTNGGNLASVGGEIIQFLNATLVSGQTYTLSGLLRGRRGTEQFIGTHAANEKFIMLTEGSVVDISYATSEINATRYFEGVNDAPYSGTTGVQNIVLTTRRLLPYAPCHIRASRDGSFNITITGLRRSRTSGTPLWSPPDLESPIKIEIDIKNGSSVVRTLTSTLSANGSGIIDANAFEAYYDHLDQTADFGSTQSSLTVVAYQISSVVGRGYGRTATI